MARQFSSLNEFMSCFCVLLLCPVSCEHIYSLCICHPWKAAVTVIRSVTVTVSLQNSIEPTGGSVNSNQFPSKEKIF